MTRLKSIAILSLACLFMGNSSSRAAYLSVSSAVFIPTDASINIQVLLENNSSSILNLAAFSFELEVTPISTRRVEFNASSQPDSLTDPNYVFFGNSSDQTTPTTPLSLIHI